MATSTAQQHSTSTTTSGSFWMAENQQAPVVEEPETVTKLKQNAMEKMESTTDQASLSTKPALKKSNRPSAKKQAMTSVGIPPPAIAAPVYPGAKGKRKGMPTNIDNSNSDEGEDEDQNMEEDGDVGDMHQITLYGDADIQEQKANQTPAEPVKPRRGRRRLLHNEEQRKNRRKMQCKLNQRRYRARQRGMISSLSLETETLTDHIQELESYYRFLSKYTHDDQSYKVKIEEEEEEDMEIIQLDHQSVGYDNRPLLVVKQFFRFFRHGFALHSVEISELQENFLRFVSDPRLTSQGATENGVDALLLQLKRYTSYHAVFEIMMESIRVLQSPADFEDEASPVSSMSVVQATGKINLRLSRDTLMLVYPHIIENEGLSLRIVGQEIDPTFSSIFHFNAKAKLCNLELMIDFTGAFMRLLKNPEETALLMGRALITPFCELGIDPRGAPPTISTGVGDNKQLSLKFILL